MLRSGHIDQFARKSLPRKNLLPTLKANEDTQYPARLNAAASLIDAPLAAGWGMRTALINHDASCTYAQLAAQANRIAHFLLDDLKLVPGNRVLLRGANTPMMAACWLGIVKAGMVAVATMPLLRAKELLPVIDKAKIQAAICDYRLNEELLLAQQVSPLLRRLAFFSAPETIERSQNLDELIKTKPITFKACDTARDDVALIAFTSGTTGVPKGTMHYHSDVMAMCDLFPRHILKPTSSDIFCGTPPLAFTFGLGGLLAFPLRIGASTLLLDGLTPEKLLLSIEKHRATVCFTAPTFYRQMVLLLQASPDKYDISSLQKCVSAGEALPDATRALWRAETGLDMIDGIGATEMIHIFIASAGPDIKPGAIGKVVPGYEAKIVDEKFGGLHEVSRGQVGKLAVRGPTGCKYLADDRQKVYVKDGWNLSGDSFVVDDLGYFVYQARSDDMIISAGYNIAGPEVEATLLQHPAVAECGVVGLADEERGQVVKAFVVLKAGYVATDQTVGLLQNYVKENIAPYKYPRAIEFIAALPRTETGKLQRFKLKSL